MVKDLLISFKENFKTKTSNPFFGTLILIWVTKNWNLIYSIFNFDPKTTLEVKRNFIITHFTLRPFIETLLLCILESFVILLISFILINLSRLIVNFFEKRITPFVYKWTDEKSIVLKSVYDTSENERKRLEKRVEEEREAKLKLQEDYDKLEKRFAELFNQNAEQRINEKLELEKKTTKPNDIQFQSDDKIDLIINMFRKGNKIEAFENIASSILNNETIQKSNKIIGEITTMGLVVPGPFRKSPDWHNYSLTPLGKEIHERLLIDKLK